MEMGSVRRLVRSRARARRSPAHGEVATGDVMSRIRPLDNRGSPHALFVALFAALLTVWWVLAGSIANAQPRLPYQAYGTGVTANATVEAVKDDVVLSSTKADAQGNWMLQIPPERAQDGDAIGFRVNGKRARETIAFRSARFPAPPGLVLTVEGEPGGDLGPAGDAAASTGGRVDWVLVAGGAGAVIAAVCGLALLRQWSRRRRL